MFDAVRNNKRIVQIFLGLITLPFAFWGVDSYMKSGGAGSDVASVGDTKITYPQFEQALRERQDQMRQGLGARFKPEMMNSPEVRLSILNRLIDQRVLMLEANKSKLATSDEALRAYISRMPMLQENGKFSMQLYELWLTTQGMSQPQFESKLRQDLTLQQLLAPIGAMAFVSKTQAEAMLKLQSEERQFSEFKIASDQFADKVKIEPAAVQKYYDENKARFEVPEQAKAEFVILSLDALMSQVTVSDAEIKAWYEDHKDSYQQPEERRASHILILAKGDADKEKAKAKAEEVLKEVRKDPAKFADLAKRHSEDPGSAKNGGDLGFFGRKDMVKAFSETVFSQKEGEISGLVESEYGFHIIKTTGIKGGKLKTLDEVRAEIEGELKRQAASRKFAEAAETFNNMVYEQSESLQPVVEKFKLKTQQTGWLPRSPDPQVLATMGPFADPKILAALFSEDAVKNKRNTEAVEIAPNTLLAARVLEHVPAATRPFESVKADIEKMLKAQEMLAQAKRHGEAFLAELNGGQDKLAWSAAKSVTRLQPKQLPPAALQAIFKAGVQKLPAYVGVGVGENHMLYKITKVTQPEKIDENQLKGLQGEYGQVIAQQDFAGYLLGLRQRYKIDVNKAALEVKER